MTFRGSQIYVRSETRKLLKLIATARGLNETADEIGDTLLQAAILVKYPEIKPFLQKIEETEQEMILALRK